MAEFDIVVSKPDFKFNCAHFIAHNGFRERLHGHNYQIGVKVTGEGYVCKDGYLIDFGDIKKAARKLCKEMNEYFIVPARTTDIVITEVEGQICLECEDGAKFSFPKGDCAMLPIMHSSAEELAHYFWCMMIRRIGLANIHDRGIRLLEVSVAEAQNQVAAYRAPIPRDEAHLDEIMSRPLNIRPPPCFQSDEE